MEKLTETLSHEEVKTVEKTFKYSCILYLNDALRFRFDLQQFEPMVLYEIEFLDLLPLYNEYYYRYNKEFLNLYKKTYYVIKAVGYEDTFLLLLTNEEKNYNRLCDLSKMKSYKYKANFTKAERSLIYRLRHSVSYRCLDKDYLSDMEVQMEEMSEYIAELQVSLDEKSDRADTLRYKYRLSLQCYIDEFYRLCDEIEDIQDEILILSEDLEALEKKYNSLKYGGDEPITTIDDYQW